MSNWNELLKEIKEQEVEVPLDLVRRKYIKNLYELTGRNVICYYSGFLSNTNHPDISINDTDISGFMTAMHKLDKTKGLDLIIHTPGGEVAATEAIGNYLREFFKGDIRVIIPQLAMSGGTMLSCISKEIVMGKHSSIGPIDPQFGGIPCYGVIEEFETAEKEITEKPQTTPLWQMIINKYHPTFIGSCYKAIELSTDLVQKWLRDGAMFENDEDKEKKIQKIIKYLNNTTDTKIHSRHISNEKAKELGLKITDLENDDEFQDAVLSIHHCYMHTFSNSNAVKIIENHNGIATVAIAQNINKN